MLYQSVIHAAMARRASFFVANVYLVMNSVLNVEKNDSAAALSNAVPVRPIDWVMFKRVQASLNSPDLYSEPRSV